MTRNSRLGLMLVLSAALPPTCGFAVEKPACPRPVAPRDVVLQTDLRYGKHAVQMLDLVTPRGDGPFPLVVLLHGTGPFSQGRQGNLPLAMSLAQKGYAAASVGFRYGAKDGYLAPYQDAAAALRWLRAHAAAHRIDGRRIAALGYSGGGTVAHLLGLGGGKIDGAMQPSDEILLQAVITFSAPSDLLALHRECCAAASSDSMLRRLEGCMLKSLLEEWIGASADKAAERYRQMSPVSYVRKNGPPLLLLHGTRDTIVSCSHSQRLAEQMQQKGGTAQLVLFDGAPHCFEMIDNYQSRLAKQAVELFLAETLGHKIAR